MIRTPDQRLRVFVSSTLHELAAERRAARSAIAVLRLAPVLFELGARPHPPRELYRAYLDQSHVFVGIYWERYGWVAPGETISGLEDEYRLSGDRPKLIYVKGPAPDREERLEQLLTAIQSDDAVSYKHFETAADLEALLVDDLALLLSERFESDDERAPLTVAPVRRPAFDAPLPIPPTPLVGRAEDLRRLVETLRSSTVRLATLVGTGGVGKTRLALAVAHEVGPDFTDGVVWVDLGSAEQHHEAVAEIARAVGAAGEEEPDVTAALRDRTVLVVLDTVEHVANVGDTVGRLLATLPGLTVLATGRGALRISAEHVVLVPPLSLPASDGADIGDAEAGRLLLDRALAARPDLVVDDEVAQALATICQVLDGLPLALELAAARVRLLSPRTIADRLQRDGGVIGLLTDGARDLPDRQRTLAATIAWSHRLLDDDAARVLSATAVFAGTVDIESVEALVPDAEDLIGALTVLVEGSLLTSEDCGQGPTLEVPRPVREYVLDAMATAGTLDTARRRHAQHVLAVVRATAPTTWSRPGAALDALDPWVDDLREALRWSIEAEEPTTALALCSAAFRYWQRRGRLTEGRAFLADALAVPGEVADDLRGRALFAASVLAGQQGDIAGGRSLATESVGLLRATDDRAALADALNSLGTLVQEQGDHDHAIELLEEALAIRRSDGDRWGILVGTLNLGNTHFMRGAPTEAERRWSEALAVAEADGEDYVRAMVLMNVGALRKDTGDLTEARRLFEESRELREALDDAWGLSTTLANLGELAAAEGRLDESAAHLRRALGIQSELGDRKGIVILVEAVARLALAAGDDRAAARFYGAGEALRRDLDIPVLGPEAEQLVEEAGRLRARAGDVTGPWREGAAMTIEGAADAARAYVDRVGVPDAAVDA